jgi:type IV secretion system protein VirB4
MIKLSRIVKDYQDSGAVNSLVNLFGFIDEHVFLTKSGEVGVVLRVEGRDYECMDTLDLNEITRRFEACVRAFDPAFRIYQYLIKRDGARIPRSADYRNPVVRQAAMSRADYLESKAEELYSIEVYFVVLYEGSRYDLKMVEKLKLLAKRPAAALSLFSIEKSILLIDEFINRGHQTLVNKVNSFVIQLQDYVPIRVAAKAEAFTFFRRLLNFAHDKADLPALEHNTFLDFYVCDSQIECHRGFLRLDDYYVKVLTLKDPPAKTEPNLLRHLQELPSECIIVSEFKRVENFEMRRLIQSKRRHFHNSKTSIMSYINLGGEPQHPDQMLVDDSASAIVSELGNCLTEMEVNSNYFGQLSLTVVLYDREKKRLEKSVAEAFKVFAARDAVLVEERYNLLNAFCATLPANYRYNLRYMYLLNSNYGDLSFLFRPQSGEAWNSHLNAEYLAAFETNQQTPYFLNLHYQDIPHTLLLGMTGSGKSFTCNFLLTHAQKYDPRTVIFDLGGSYRMLTQLFGGSYLQIGVERRAFTINPFSLAPSEDNLHFLFSFVKVLIESSGTFRMSDRDERELYNQVASMYAIDRQQRRLITLLNILPKNLEPHLRRWVEGGQYGNLFDNVADNLTFANFQTFDFEGLDKFPQILEPLLFYILHRANAGIYEPALATTLKIFLLDEAWRFFRNPTVKDYIVEAMKTWRKKNAAMILATQSSADLTRNEMLQLIAESCGTLIFLANPRMDKRQYRDMFHLNETEAELIASLAPKRQLLVKRPDLAKVVQLNVASKDYWIYTNSPYDNERKQQAFERLGFERGLEFLSGQSRGADESGEGINRAAFSGSQQGVLELERTAS